MVHSSFLQNFDLFWEVHIATSLPATDFYIVCVSGGVDSIVLASLLAKKGCQFIIAHCNFHLRGAESDRDEAFVKKIGESIQKEVFIKDFDTVAYSQLHKIGIEEAARELRYTWFRELANQYGKDKNPAPIFVAHHANDNIETLLINFFRGCGISGLHGIQAVKNGIFRPLLFAKRKEIVQYALANHLTWVEDSTNNDSHYLRNFFRNELIPDVAQHIPAVENNLLDNIQRLQDVEMVYQQYFENLKQRLFKTQEKGISICINELTNCKPLATTVYELFRNFGLESAQVPELIKLLSADSGAKMELSRFTFYKDRNQLFITQRITERDKNNKQILPDAGQVDLENGSYLRIVDSVENYNPSAKNMILDAEKIVTPLHLRHWKSGDYFYPAGMNGKKKLAKFFVDLKIPVPIKDSIWLVTTDNDQIVWVVGYRADRRFVATKDTSKQIHISIQEK